MMGQWQEDHFFADLCIFQTDSARKTRFGVDTQASGTLLSKLIVAERKKRLKFCQWQTDDSKVCLHAG